MDDPSSCRRVVCSGCRRPRRVCICDALPANYLRPSSLTPHIVIQHRRERARKLRSASILELCLDPSYLEVIVARSVHSARSKSIIWTDATRAGRRPLYLFPHADAMSPDSLFEELAQGKRFCLIVIDGTWSEAKEMLNTTRRLDVADSCLSDASEKDDDEPCFLDVCALAPDGGLFAGCRKPASAGCLSTLEAAALAIDWIDQCACALATGESLPPRVRGPLAEALLRPLLRMVALQVQLTGERVVHRPNRPGYVPGLVDVAVRAAEKAGLGKEPSALVNASTADHIEAHDQLELPSSGEAADIERADTVPSLLTSLSTLQL